ncbi:DinB family protein [Roseivivax sp. THAF30]|uniref:DinB family protein n=1 Tax=Roseivivax sp. THAF30 TaxID=2587852 RepID=UPI0012689788|nr:DinB family protein [Roseivivax sp. THAF30]QFT63691.1 DinB family protein [Roseivivax sp. THAF30]
MIDASFTVQMARYNAWQNRQLKAIFKERGEAWLRETGQGFFGSIFATANHLLWADTIWMARFTQSPAPKGGIAESIAFTDTLPDWDIARFRMDARILDWAENLRSTELFGDLAWYSGAQGREVSRPRALCVAHMFNHQTHHRGQIHAMLTAAGATAPVSDLAFMPEDGPVL